MIGRAASPPQGAADGPLRDPLRSCLTTGPVQQSWTSRCLDRLFLRRIANSAQMSRTSVGGAGWLATFGLAMVVGACGHKAAAPGAVPKPIAAAVLP